MEGDAVSSDSGVPGLSVEATATDAENTLVASDGTGDLPAERIPETDTQLSRPIIQYSTDLRKELSLDVLASLGDLSADEAKTLKDSLTDLPSVSADMEFIPEMSTLNLPLDHVDLPAPDTVPTLSANTAVEPRLVSDAAGARLVSDGSLRSQEVTVDSHSPVPVDASHSDAFAETLRSSAATIVNAMTAVTAALVDDSRSEDVSVDHSSPVFDAIAGVLPILAPQDRSQPALADLQVSHADPASIEVSNELLESLSSPLTRFPILDGERASLEASNVPLAGLSSAVDMPLSELARVPLTYAPVPVETLSSSFAVPPPAGDAVASVEAHFVASEPVYCTSVDPIVMDISPTTLRSPSGDNAPSEAATVSLEPQMTFETVKLDPPVLDGSPLGNEPFLDADGATRVPVSVTSSVLFPHVPDISLPSALLNGSTSLSAFTALNHPSVPLISSLAYKETTALEARTSFSTTLLPTISPAAVSPSVPEVAPVSCAPFLGLREVLPGDSLPSPPDTALLWDAPSSSGVSLSAYFDGSRAPFRGRKSARKKRPAETGVDLKDAKGKGVSDAEKVEDVAELERMLEVQKKVLQWQIDEIQSLTALQCQLTGSNPLAEELVWDVLGVKGGKKSGDALSPEALKCLKDNFAIKDTLSKKEARDISVSSGASLMQVREFFAAQRSLVRKLVQDAHDEAGRLGITNASEQSQETSVLNTISEVEKDLGFDKLAGVESLEKFVELMRAEKGFAGQAQLLQVILRTDSSALILRRFIEKGGLKVLAGWLVEAAAEEQTSVISHLLQVLDHLPMSNAVQPHLPPLVPIVNKLRSYHVSDVTGQARLLIAKWRQMFLPETEGVKSASSQGSRITTGNDASQLMPSGAPKRKRDARALQQAPGLRKKKVKAEAVPQNEFKPAPVAVPGSPSVNGTNQGTPEHSVPIQVSTTPRSSSTLQPSESAVAAVSVSRKRLASISLGDQSKERRKLVRVEDNHEIKNVLPRGSKPTISNASRPISTDDIYIAKKRERLMQEPVAKPRKKLAAFLDHGQNRYEVSPTSIPKKSSSPVVPGHASVPKKAAISSQNSDQKTLGRGSLKATSSQEDSETAQHSYVPSRIQEDLEKRQTVTPTSSQEILQTTSTPTSSQEISCPTGAGDIPDHTIDARDSVLSERMGSVMADSSRSVSVAADDVVNMGHSLSAPRFDVPEKKEPVIVDEKIPSSISFSKSGVVDDASLSQPSIELADAVLDQPPRSSISRGLINLVDKFPMDVAGSKDDIILGQEFEMGGDADSSPRERTFSDFYAALRARMIRWRIPPEYQPHAQWNVAAGDDSKEEEVQSLRVKREEEAFYPEISAIPDDPKDPWEEEPNYDDSLTLEIFVDSGQRKVLTGVNSQLDMSKPSTLNIEPSGVNVSLGSNISSKNEHHAAINHEPEHSPELLSKLPVVNRPDLVSQQLSATSGGSHDPALLALLLRNPELVSQLTSGQAFSASGIANQGVFMQPRNSLKQTRSSGNNGVAINTPAGDLGHERLTVSNNSKAMGIPLQPGRSVSSVDQTPSETLRVQDSVTMIPHPGMGQQQNQGFFPQGGVDKRFLTPLMPTVAARNMQDTSGREQPRLPAPPPLPQIQPVTNQMQQPPLPSQQNKVSNWPQSQGWAGVARPSPNPPQTQPGQEQLHLRSQPIMAHNMRPLNYVGIVGVPQVEVGPVTAVVPQQDVHHGQRAWSNGSHGAPVHENAMMQAAHESLVVRNSRWPRPPVRPPDQRVRSGSREFSDGNVRQSNVIDTRSVWVPNDRARPAPPPFQGGYGLPPPPQYSAPQWQAQASSARPGQGGAGTPFPHGRELRPPQQQPWPNNPGPSSRQIWRGQ